MHANTNRDGINYTARGGYNDLDFAALVARYGGGFQGSPEVPNSMPSGTPTPAPSNFPGYRLGKIGKRWVFVDPLGKVMLLRGLYKTSPDQTHKIGGGQQAGRTLINNIRTKYAGAGSEWDEATATRLKQFHYNSTASASRNLSGHGIPFQRQSNSGIYALSDVSKPVLSERVKDVLKHGVRQNLPGQAGWAGRHLIDSFDPKFKQFIDYAWGRINPDPNTLFFQADDGDYMYAFGIGHPDEMEGYIIADSNWGPHGGVIALIGKPNITGPVRDFRGGTQTWSVDTVNHTKRALVDYLIAKYSTIDALNAAWKTGGYYTTFESAGGWGVGRGLLDEDGMRPRTWLGKDGAPFYQKKAGQNDFFNSTRWAPNVKVDLDIFLGMMMDAYLKPFAERLQLQYPGALFIGHTGKTSRKPVVESYGRWLHLLRAGSTSETLNAIMAKWQARDLPWVAAMYYPNNDDGCMYYVPKGDGTQAQRGASIAHNLTRQLTYRDADGTYRILGNNFWGLYDQPGEKIGWGIFSYNDNPYDGRDYRLSQPDPYTPGRTTLTEDRVYGDALTPIKNAHIAQFTTLQTQFAR
ncbi:MAG: hypothetical protein ACRDX9_11845 [Acidimicrobiia bacterium]